MWNVARYVGGFLVVSLVAAPAAPGSRTPGNPRFYDMFGERYYVLRNTEGYSERGVASWYGDPFHGNPTASGESYDMYALTAAHKTLPLPTDVEVTNLRNGKTIVVRVNDRGPFFEDRIIDLSYAAAKALDLVAPGTGLVEVRVVGTGSRGAPSSAP